MKKALRSILFVAGAIATSFAANAADIIISDDGSGTGTTTWTADNTYILDGFVFVNSGQALTIEAGTVVKGMSGTGADASALVVARGGQIFANGTADEPIIFTFEEDALDGSTPYNERGRWGGLIILGDAQLNSTPGETQIEGIPDTEPRGLYGGDNDMDNSGVITYISIRHGGTDIGAGNEINGLTLGGVGAGTVIDYVEVTANADDGIEFFGGTASVKHAAVTFCGDDSYDYDEGWRGYGQFWFTMQDDAGDGSGDRGGEHDGGTDPEDGLPYAHPVIFNVTSMGRGISAGRRALTFRDNAAGEYHNSIFYNWGRGIDIENLASGEDTYNRFVSGELAFAGNCFDNVRVAGTSATASDLFTISMGSGWASDADSTNALAASSTAFEAAFAAGNNNVASLGLQYQLEEGTAGVIAIPTTNLSEGSAPTEDWFTDVTYKGAFDPSENCTWMAGWTLVDQRGFIGCVTSVEEENDFASLSIYPNPANDRFFVAADQTVNNATISVYSITGALLIERNNINLIEGQSIEMNAADLSEGVYLVQIQAGSNLRTSRLIIK